MRERGRRRVLPNRRDRLNWWSRRTDPPGAKAWLPLNFLDNPVNGATSCPAFSSFAVTPPGVGRAYTVQAPDSGAGYPADCGGIEVPTLLSTAETVIPSGG